ncbi:unnamed protein product [Lactuca virosa]|uniref:Replication factor A C-terminal domain-containing protein n=1 Tax=Lactuca virosa TaxID=75947 RepID=A0AAU9LG74_9ASTR|nr:unnamed protein product [Lactuca virosa]
MCATNITLIADLDVIRDDLSLKGSKIQAAVPKKLLYRFKNVLKDGKSYYITCPSFAALKHDTFRLTPQDQKLAFVQETVVKECTEFSGPRFGFSFVDFQSVLSMVHPQNLSLMVWNCVWFCGVIMRTKMQEYIQDNPNNLQIIFILQFAQINVWRDRPNVNTYYTSSRLFINSDIDEITVFKRRLDGDDRPDSSSHTFSLIPSNQVSEYDDFVVKNKLKTISEVWEPVEICTFIIVGTIKGILQNEKWFYQACTNCSSKAVPINDEVDGTTKSYECHNEHCTKTKTSVVSRFKIPIRVQDNTSTITLTVFEREGRYLLKKSAKEFFNAASKNGDNVDLYAVEMNALKGLKFAFKISSTRFNVSKKTNQYGISRVTDDESLIEQLEDRFTCSQADNSQSLDFNSADSESQDNKTLKDAISAMDDNITPSTLDKNSATSPMKISTTTPVLKRDLQQVFDMESNEKLSSSKTPKISPDGPGKELLKVKLEKKWVT